MSNIKLKDHNWDTTGIYDSVLGKTQRQINENTKSSLSVKSNTIGKFWAIGYWASSDGSCNTSSNKWLRTNHNVDSDITEIKCSNDYKMYLLGYNEHTYVGEWNGITFRTPAETSDATTYFNLQSIREAYPAYTMRISVTRNDNAKINFDDACENILITKPLPVINNNIIEINSGNIANGKYWENGSIKQTGAKDYNANVFNKRVSNINFFRFITPVVIKPKTGFWFSVSVFELDGTFVMGSPEWIACPYIFSNPNKLYRVNIRPENDDIELYPSNIANYIESSPYYISSFESISADCMNVKVAAHRGYSFIAPENTIPAFRIASQYGFKYVEFDVRYTLDGIPVILHDTTINRTGRNLDGTALSSNINIANINYANLANYDFGIWKGTQFSGTKIPTLNEALYCCKVYNLHPYIELKKEHTYTSSDISEIINLVKQNGMDENVTFISDSLPALTELKNQLDTVELGYAGTIAEAETLKTGKNRVFMSFKYNADFSAAVAAGFQVELWGADTLSAVDSITNNGFDVLVTTTLLPSQVNALLIDKFRRVIG